MSYKRLTPDERREVILKGAAAVAAREQSVMALTRQNVADACEVQTSKETVKKYFPRLADLRDIVKARV